MRKFGMWSTKRKKQKNVKEVIRDKNAHLRGLIPNNRLPRKRNKKKKIPGAEEEHVSSG